MIEKQQNAVAGFASYHPRFAEVTVFILTASCSLEWPVGRDHIEFELLSLGA